MKKIMSHAYGRPLFTRSKNPPVGISRRPCCRLPALTGITALMTSFLKTTSTVLQLVLRILQRRTSSYLSNNSRARNGSVLTAMNSSRRPPMRSDPSTCLLTRRLSYSCAQKCPPPKTLTSKKPRISLVVSSSAPERRKKRRLSTCPTSSRVMEESVRPAVTRPNRLFLVMKSTSTKPFATSKIQTLRSSN